MAASSQAMTRFQAPETAFSGLDPEIAAKLIAASADIALVLDAQGTVIDLSFGNEDFEKEGYSYDPEAHGFITLIEEADKGRVLTEIWDDWTLVDIPWEGISIVDGFFQAVFLANNEFGIVFIIPDAPWVDGKLREVIEDHLDP